MYLEYDWMIGVYRPRFGSAFTSINGWRSFETLHDAKHELGIMRLKLGAKTDTRTWQIIAA